MSVKENLPIMVLTSETQQTMLFEFKSALWGYATILLSCLFGIASYFAFLEPGNNFIIISILCIFTLIFLYSSIYSFKLTRSIEIDRTQHVVRYVESSLYKHIKWQKTFDQFEIIKAFRPSNTATSGGRAKSWTIQLISKQAEVFGLGYNQFGALTQTKAEELVTKISLAMSLKQEVVE